jgi:hypothetical protein
MTVEHKARVDQLIAVLNNWRVRGAPAEPDEAKFVLNNATVWIDGVQALRAELVETERQLLAIRAWIAADDTLPDTLRKIPFAVKRDLQALLVESTP